MSVGIVAPATQAGPVVRFDLDYSVDGSNGPIDYFDIELFDTEAPITVANFLKYVNNGLYDNTIIHRDMADFVMQGGGFTPTVEEGVVTSLDPITTYDSIQNEFSSTRSNLIGTIAMAKISEDAGGGPDSATSQWFVNLGDNSANLDNQNGGFTVFGKVRGEGMTLINAIDSLPKYNLAQSFGGAFTHVPMRNNGDDFVTITKAAVLPPEKPEPEPEPEPVPVPPGSLSGFAYVDANQNGVMDDADFAIAGARVSLMQAGSSTPVATVTSAADGSYHFNNLGIGTFSIKMESPSYAPGQDNGTGQMMLDADGNVVSTGAVATPLRSANGDIVLDGGQNGVNFNVVAATYPVALISARMLLNTPEPVPHTKGVAIPTTNAGEGLDFGKVLVGKTGTQALKVTNTGTQGGVLSGTFPTVSGPFGSEGDAAFGPVAADETAGKDYTYTPTARGANTLSATVVTDAGNLPLTFSGTAVAPVASISQTTAYTLVNRTKAAVVTVTNTGDGNLSGLGDESNLKGSIAASTGAFVGDGGEINFIDGESKSFNYDYSPTIRGTETVTIVATFENGSSDGTNAAHTQNLTITGTGVAPVQSVNTTAVDLGKVRIGTNATANFTVKNIGNGNLSGLGAESNLAGIVSAGTGQFTGSGGNVSLADSASQTFSYSYTPTDHAAASLPVEFAFTNGSDDETNQAQTVNAEITGQGVGPVYSGSQAPNSVLDFGTTTGTPVSLTFGITNASTDNDGGNATLTDLTLLSAEISGTNAGLFDLPEFAANTLLHAGDLLNLEISYTGDIGLTLATLTITTDQGSALGASGDAFVYQLRANGIEIPPAPEPSTICLLGTGAIGLWAYLWRRRNRRMSF